MRKVWLHVALEFNNMAGAKRSLSQEFSALKDIHSPVLRYMVWLLNSRKWTAKVSILKGELLMKTTMHVIGFEKRQRDQLAVQKDLKQPVELHNCVIQKERRGDGMEVVISGSTKISTSPRKYKDIGFRKPPEKCTVSQIKDKDDSELTTLMIKVLKVSTKHPDCSRKM